MARRPRFIKSDETFHYDRHGRVCALLGPHGVTRYQWDNGRLVDVSGPASSTLNPNANPYALSNPPHHPEENVHDS